MKMSSNTEIKVTCPKCFSEFITALPEKMLWERCAACLCHVWDADDLMMEAEATTSYKKNGKVHVFTVTH